ncbi:MAG: class II glutamine amidotransferase [Candidatus Nanopelagicales bacterium]
MCRLLAWRTPRPVCPEELLGADRDSLATLSRVHCDGWGIATVEPPDALELLRGSEPAHMAPAFAEAMRSHASQAGLVHLRWATEDLAVTLGNTHPFDGTCDLGPVAFVHNGMLPRSEELLPDIDADLVASFRGDTDSERYFGLFMTELRREHGDIASAMQQTAKRLSDVAYTSLNAMILTPRTLAVACLFKPENRPLDEEEDYFDLTWSQQDGTISAWSTGVRPHAPGSRPLPNGTLLVVDIPTGNVDLVSIS